tara:strand:+ start:1164 stop:1460 length:297 start_codon:yes stop_codon:yes gene_type:complete
METIVWSKNEHYKKSKKEDKPITNDKNEVIFNVLYRGEQINKKKMLEENIENSNKIKELNERTFTKRDHLNPFLNKNYSDVLDDQHNYLIPKNSSMQN